MSEKEKQAAKEVIDSLKKIPPDGVLFRTLGVCRSARDRSPRSSLFMWASLL